MKPRIDFYEVLGISDSASLSDIKVAYRNLAKQVHPDTQTADSNHDRIAEVNAAYEILKDPKRRQAYDVSRKNFNQESIDGIHDNWTRTAERTKKNQDVYRQRTQGKDTERQLQEWLKRAYRPANYQLSKLLKSLTGEIRKLSADPYDDELMENFQTYLEDCRTAVEKAQTAFRSYPNPDNVASVAALLYHCINHLDDGVDELERFTSCYDDHYLATGRELFRISNNLRKEAQTAMKQLY